MRIAFVFLSLLILQACSFTGGNSRAALDGINSQADAARVIRVGMTTNQVTAKLGAPSVTNTFGSTTRWNYHLITDPVSAKSLLRRAVSINPFNTKILNIYFSANGRVQRVEYQAVNRS